MIMEFHIYLNEDDLKKLCEGESVMFIPGARSYLLDPLSDRIVLQKDPIYFKDKGD